jgi:hypothetical protein
MTISNTLKYKCFELVCFLISVGSIFNVFESLFYNKRELGIGIIMKNKNPETKNS